MTSFNINKCVKGAWDDEHNEQIKWDKALRKAKQHPNFGKILMSPTDNVSYRILSRRYRVYRRNDAGLGTRQVYRRLAAG